MVKTRVFSHGKSSTAALSQWYVIILSNHVLKMFQRNAKLVLRLLTHGRLVMARTSQSDGVSLEKLRSPKKSLITTNTSQFWFDSQRRSLMVTSNCGTWTSGISTTVATKSWFTLNTGRPTGKQFWLNSLAVTFNNSVTTNTRLLLLPRVSTQTSILNFSSGWIDKR